MGIGYPYTRANGVELEPASSIEVEDSLSIAISYKRDVVEDTSDLAPPPTYIIYVPYP